MSEQALTRADIADAVYRQIGLSRKAAADLVDELFEEMCRVLEQGEDIKLSGFGNFEVRSKNERIGRNPKTGKEVPIKPRKVLTFKASHILKAAVDGK